MFRSIRHTKDFAISLNYDKTYELPPGASSHKFVEYSVSGLTDASEKLVNHNSLLNLISTLAHKQLNNRDVILPLLRNCRLISFRLAKSLTPVQKLLAYSISLGEIFDKQVLY
jgi:hypothetical protein